MAETAAGNWELRAWNRDDALLVEDKFDHLKAPNFHKQEGAANKLLEVEKCINFVVFFQQNKYNINKMICCS